MQKFYKVYPFTTENIGGYLRRIDLKHKKIITVNGSGDHVLNLIMKGAKEIDVFDINSSSISYTKEKINYIKKHTYKEFINDFFDVNSFKLYKKYEMEFKYFDKENKIKNNLYLKKRKYNKLKKNINDVKIKYINKNVTDLVLDKMYDYMFLSNISDYLSLIYKNKYLYNYKKLIMNFLKNVKTIYFAYIYDINKTNYRSDIDNIDYVKKEFKKIKIKKIKTALLDSNSKDGVLIIERKDYYGK